AEGLELLDQVGPYAVFRMVYSLPRVWAVREAVVAESPDDALRRVLVPSYHPGDTVVLEEPPGVGPLTRGERPEVRVEHYAPQRIVLWARASAPAVLVLSETYYPGWRAWRDGVEVPVRRANYVVRALDLPPGEHRFEVVYDPLSFKVGAGISVATLLGVLAVLGVGWLKGGFPTRASRRAREIQAEVGATSAPVEGAPTRTSG
ncbi:MAG TPA: YfhO family protein, partial [Chloroflexota bacterium]